MEGPSRNTESVRLTLLTTKRAAEYLRQLVSTGLYGRNVAEVAERLIAQQLGETLVAGFDVFLSHSSKDARLAQEMARSLKLAAC